MKNKLISISMFAVGASIGSFTTWKLTKDYYAHLSKEEIESVKEAFNAQDKIEHEEEPVIDDIQEEVTEVKPKDTLNKELFKEYSKHTTNYGSYFKDINTDEMGEEVMDEQRVIRPEEFGELEDYDTTEFTYFADGNLVDDNGDIVDDVEGTVGYDALTKFGLYEPDSVYIRNDRLQCDYLVLMDQRNYSDVIGE